MHCGYLQTMLFLFNRPEPIRQSSLLMVLASGMGNASVLLDGLYALAVESSPPWSSRLMHLRMLLEQGQPLSDALAGAPRLLPDETLMAIRVAESTETLKQVLTEEAHRLTNDSTAGNSSGPSFMSTIAWILFVTIVGKGIVGFLMMYIVPKMKKIFSDFGSDFPAVTQLMIDGSDWMLANWFFLVLPGVTLLFYWGWKLNRAFAAHISTGHVLGSSWFPRFWTPRILRLLSITVATGQPLETGLHHILRELVPGRAQRRLSGVRQQLTSGGDCWDAMHEYGFLRSREVDFLEAAVRTHHLDWALLHLSHAINRRRSGVAQRLQEWLNVIVIIGVGLIVAMVCAAFFVPLVKLINSFA